MSTIFEQIREGQIPGKFLWKDDQCFAIMDIRPHAPGHALVIPNEPIDKWTDLPDELRDHLFDVAAKIGRAQEVAFDAPRSVVVVAGFLVPHVHIHVMPAESEEVINTSNAKQLDPEEFEEAYQRLSGTLADEGYEEVVLRANRVPDAEDDLEI